jgi:hypothetical protein
MREELFRLRLQFPSPHGFVDTLVKAAGEATRIPMVDVSGRHVLVLALLVALGRQTRLGQQESQSENEDHSRKVT